MLKADLQVTQELLERRVKKDRALDTQIEECDKKIFRKRIQRSTSLYNMTQAAKIVGVHRETLYYWIKKGWINPKRDYRNYPVYTVLDIENLIKWKNQVKP